MQTGRPLLFVAASCQVLTPGWSRALCGGSSIVSELVVSCCESQQPSNSIPQSDASSKRAYCSWHRSVGSNEAAPSNQRSRGILASDEAHHLASASALVRYAKFMSRAHRSVNCSTKQLHLHSTFMHSSVTAACLLQSQTAGWAERSIAAAQIAVHMCCLQPQQQQVRGYAAKGKGKATAAPPPSAPKAPKAEDPYAPPEFKLKRVPQQVKGNVLDKLTDPQVLPLL